jgi:TPP-dependent indolepyruvate ferredoxin oxidoreductase alpha subunit
MESPAPSTTSAWRTRRHLPPREAQVRGAPARGARYIVEHGLNELLPAPRHLGIIVQGGLYNTLVRALQQFGLADAFGERDIPLLVLNVTYPLVPEEIADFCRGKRAVLVVEEGQPEYIEQEIATPAAPRRHRDRAARQGPAADGRRVHRRGDRRRAWPSS